MDINKVILVGRLTRDAELKYTNSGTAVSKLSVAVNRRVKHGDKWEDEVSFFNVLVWGKTAEALNQYLTKGKQIGIEGELRQNRYTDKNGQNRSNVEINSNNIQLLGGNNSANNNKGVTSQDVNKVFNGQPTQNNNLDFEDDIPF